MCFSTLQYDAASRSVLQCIAVHCSILGHDRDTLGTPVNHMLQCVAVCVAERWKVCLSALECTMQRLCKDRLELGTHVSNVLITLARLLIGLLEQPLERFVVIARLIRRWMFVYRYICIYTQI